MDIGWKFLETFFIKHQVEAPVLNEIGWESKLLHLVVKMDKQIDDLQYKLAAAREKK